MFVVLSGRLVSRFRRIGRGRMNPGMNDVLSRGTALVGLWRGGIAIPARTASDPKLTSDVRTTTAAIQPRAGINRFVFFKTYAADRYRSRTTHLDRCSGAGVGLSPPRTDQSKLRL